MSHFFERHGLTPVINVSGTETVKGASPVCPEVIAAVAAITPHSVDMQELQDAAGRLIAPAVGAEAAIVAHCSAAGITMAIAACLVGDDLAAIERLPQFEGVRREVILQRGHNVNYGAPIVQTITAPGATPIEIGAATECHPHSLAAALSPRAAAMLFVVSHHTVQSGMVDLATVCRLCHDAAVPLIVDAAAEPDPRRFFAAGADLVITSLHKRFASLTGAIVAGRAGLVRATLRQEKGIGRPMKAGKETVAAAIAAVERWQALDHGAIAAATLARLACGQARLGRLRGLTVTVEPDSASGGRFSRLHLQVDPARAGRDAAGLAAALLARTPSIFVRSLAADVGLLQLDLRLVSDAAADEVFAAIEATLAAS